MGRPLEQLEDIFLRVDFVADRQNQVIRIEGRNGAPQRSSG